MAQGARSTLLKNFTLTIHEVVLSLRSLQRSSKLRVDEVQGWGKTDGGSIVDGSPPVINMKTLI
ncbi:hypothetical protein Ciccas_005518, partial [Cichlidogyrus casuarinus]